MRKDREREYKKGREQKEKENSGLGEKPEERDTNNKRERKLSGPLWNKMGSGSLCSVG